MTVGRHVRHPRDKFDPNNEFVFMKRKRFNLPDYEFSTPGDPVTPEIRKLLGPHRLKTWWTARAIATKEYAIELGVAVKPGKIVEEQRGKKASSELPEGIVDRGGNWFQVTLADGTSKKVRGRKAALAAVGN